MFKPKGVMFLTLVIVLMGLNCSGPESDQPLLTAELPLHLEEHLDAARIEGSKVPEDLPDPVVWRFDEPQSGWRPAKPLTAQWEAVKPVRVDDALRLPLTAENRGRGLPAVIIKMLMASDPGKIQLLPALPDAWPEGKISGLSARGGFEVDITWEAGKLSEAVIRSKNGNSCKLVYGTHILEFGSQAGKTYRVNQDLKIGPGE